MKENGRFFRNGPEPGLLLAWCAVAVLFQVGADDHWWHILTGKIIWTTGEIPRTDPFSYTFPGKAWTNWEWIGSLILYGFHRLFGDNGLILLRGFALSGIAGILWLHTRMLERKEPGLPAPWRFTLLLVSLAVLFPRIGDRPHTLAYLLAVLVHYLADRARLSRSAKPLLFLPLLTALWANIHPSWTLAPVIAGAVWLNILGEASREESLRRAIPRFRVWPLTLFAMLLASFLRPGLGDFNRSFGEVFTGKLSSEWVSLFEAFRGPGAWVLTLFVLLLLATAGALATSSRKRRIGDVLLMISLGVLAVHTARFTTFFAILSVPVLLRHLRWPARFGPLENSPRLRRVVVPLVFLLALVFNWKSKNDFGTPFGVGLNRKANAADAVDYLERHDLRLRPLTSATNVAAYLLWRRWPKQKVFIDGRVPTVYPPEFVERFFNMIDIDRFRAAAEEFGIGLVLVTDWREVPDMAQFARGVRSLDGWELIYFDPDALILADCRLAGAAFCERRAFRFLDPLDPELRFVGETADDAGFRRLLRDVERAVEDNPESFLAVKFLYYRITGMPPPLTEKQLEAVRDLVRRHPEARPLRDLASRLPAE